VHALLSSDDVVESDGAGVAHVDCCRPRGLTHDERSLLYGLLLGTADRVARCVARTFGCSNSTRTLSNSTRGPAARAVR